MWMVFTSVCVCDQRVRSFVKWRQTCSKYGLSPYRLLTTITKNDAIWSIQIHWTHMITPPEYHAPSHDTNDNMTKILFTIWKHYTNTQNESWNESKQQTNDISYWYIDMYYFCNLWKILIKKKVYLKKNRKGLFHSLDLYVIVLFCSCFQGECYAPDIWDETSAHQVNDAAAHVCWTVM